MVLQKHALGPSTTHTSHVVRAPGCAQRQIYTQRLRFISPTNPVTDLIHFSVSTLPAQHDVENRRAKELHTPIQGELPVDCQPTSASPSAAECTNQLHSLPAEASSASTAQQWRQQSPLMPTATEAHTLPGSPQRYRQAPNQTAVHCRNLPTAVCSKRPPGLSTGLKMADRDHGTPRNTGQEPQPALHSHQRHSQPSRGPPALQRRRAHA